MRVPKASTSPTTPCGSPTIGGGTITRIDPATNLVVATVTVGPTDRFGPQPVVVDGDRVWTGVSNIGQVVGIDAATNEVVATVDVPAAPPCGEMLVFAGSVWVTSCWEHDIVNVIDSASGILRGAVEVGGFAGTPLPIGNVVWFPTITLETGAPGRIVGIDAATLEIVDTVTVDKQAYSAGVGFDSVWLFSFDAEAVIRLPLDAFRTPRRPR